MLGLQTPAIMAGLYVGARVTDAYHHAGLYVGARDPSLGVYVYTAGTLLTEPSWAQLHFLK